MPLGLDPKSLVIGLVLGVVVWPLASAKIASARLPKSA